MFIDYCCTLEPLKAVPPAGADGYEPSVMVAEVGPQTTVQVNFSEKALDLESKPDELGTTAASLVAYM